ALPCSYPFKGSGNTLADCPVSWDHFKLADGQTDQAAIGIDIIKVYRGHEILLFVTPDRPGL
ncbi:MULTISPECIES: hypothetical protein, partial [unclassified Mameliella]|uniref:hypothetical protein n=1 Tax=unclassified Mameliella TaxID=2630630 RepID=UPI00273DC111